MYNDITIFTVDYGVPLEEVKRYKFCVDRWKEILPKNVTLKIFTKEDQIVKDCLEEFKDYFKIVEEREGEDYSSIYMCDVIRLYILSKNKHFLYLDSDLYAKDFSFLEMLDNEALIHNNKSFSFLWSGEETEKFEPFLNYYKKTREVKIDKYVIEDLVSNKKIGIKEIPVIDALFHFSSMATGKKDKMTIYYYEFCDETNEEELKLLKSYINQRPYYNGEEPFKLLGIVTKNVLTKIRKDYTEEEMNGYFEGTGNCYYLPDWITIDEFKEIILKIKNDNLLFINDKEIFKKYATEVNNDITIFTVDYGVPLEQIKRYKFCVDRWKEILPKNVTLKIFTKEDQIVKDCLEEFKDYFKIVEENCKTNYKYAYMCDVIRLYILSKNKHFLYLDSDIYIKDLFFFNQLRDKALINNNKSFSFLWSGDEPEKFEPFLSYYKRAASNKTFRYYKWVIMDRDVTLYLEKEKEINVNYCKIEKYGLLHAVSGIFKNNCIYYFFSNIEFTSKCFFLLKEKKENCKFIIKDCKNFKEIKKDLDLEAEFYNFVFFSNNFDLMKYLIENITDGYKIIYL